jgi:microcystin degradation protein MlrC
MPTSLNSFKQSVFLRPGEHPDILPCLFSGNIIVGRREAAAQGFTLIEGSCFAAEPSGKTSQAAYELMRDEILAQLKSALPLDGVLLSMHGAMVAYGYEDVEGDILERVRQIVGQQCVVGVELDPHCHLTEKRVRLADIIVLYKEFPHTDVVERAEDLVRLVLATIRGAIKPVISLYDCRQVSVYPTTNPVMRAFVDSIKAMEGKDRILSISLVHGYPYADVKDVGSRVLVIADGDKEEADRIATSIGAEFVSIRGKTIPPYLSVSEGVAAALAEPDMPIVLAEPSDNAGGGAPSDNTDIIRHLLAIGASSACVGPIWDPIAAGICVDAGLGAELPLRFGGKASRTSGEPIDAAVKVTGVIEEGWQTFGKARVELGPCAAIRVGGIDVVLVTKRVQAFGLELFRNVGIEPTERKLVVVKSINHFMAAYGPIAKKVFHIETTGPLICDYSKIPFTKATRPIWPLDTHTTPGLIA